jgi:hypothetical protein
LFPRHINIFGIRKDVRQLRGYKNHLKGLEEILALTFPLLAQSHISSREMDQFLGMPARFLTLATNQGVLQKKVRFNSEKIIQKIGGQTPIGTVLFL